MGKKEGKVMSMQRHGDQAETFLWNRFHAIECPRFLCSLLLAQEPLEVFDSILKV